MAELTAGVDTAFRHMPIVVNEYVRPNEFLMVTPTEGLGPPAGNQMAEMRTRLPELFNAVAPDILQPEEANRLIDLVVQEQHLFARLDPAIPRPADECLARARADCEEYNAHLADEPAGKLIGELVFGKVEANHG